MAKAAPLGHGAGSCISPVMPCFEVSFDRPGAGTVGSGGFHVVISVGVADVAFIAAKHKTVLQEQVRPITTRLFNGRLKGCYKVEGSAT